VTTGAPVLDVDGVWRVYGVGNVRVEALRGVSFRVGEGEFVAIMGSSGSGKSTLLSILGGLDRPTQGSYRLAGTDLATMSRDQLARVRNERIGFVFQQFHLLSRTTALENVELPLLYARGVSSRERHERARDALARVGLADRAHHRPNQLSGGQQQRVAIARALVNRPSLLLADEPTGNLDSRVTGEILALLQELNEAGLTIVFVTHEADVAQHARRKVLFRDGQIVADEPVTQRLFAAAGGAA
jgi:putative ABC transport system ATP-binding protein